MKTVIVPVDFSPISIDAVRYAISFAADLNASVSLFHVCAMPVGVVDLPYPSNLITNMFEKAEDEMDRLREGLLKAANGVKIYTEVRQGFFMEELQRYCRKLKPYAVVMSSHGTSGLQRLLLGSNTVSALRHLSWPLLVVPAGQHFSQIKKIALACDMKNVSESLPARFIGAMVKELKAELNIVHINTEIGSRYDKKLINESFALQHLFSEYKPDYHFLDRMEVEEGLMVFAEEFNIDLLVMLPKKHNIVDRLIHRSHSKDVVIHARLPVMAIHQK